MKGNDPCLLRPCSVTDLVRRRYMTTLSQILFMLLWRKQCLILVSHDDSHAFFFFLQNLDRTKKHHQNCSRHVSLLWLLQPLIFSETITVFLAYHCNSKRTSLHQYPYCANTCQIWRAGGMDICNVTGKSAGMFPFISMSHTSEWLPHNYLWGH